jgi:hypothetical protein
MQLQRVHETKHVHSEALLTYMNTDTSTMSYIKLAADTRLAAIRFQKKDHVTFQTRASARVTSFGL